MRHWARFVWVLLVAALARADEGATQVRLTLAGQGVAYSGNTSQFRELNLGVRSGVFLEQLKLRFQGEERTLSFEAFSNPGGSLRLSGDFRQGPWHTKLEVASLNAYSTLRVGEERFPLGPPSREPAFSLWPYARDREPSSRMSWGTVKVSRQGAAGTFWLEVGGRTRDGERVPEFGVVGFADNGSPAFYPMGQCQPDSSAGRMELGWFGVFAETGVRLTLGAEDATDRERCGLAAFGTSGFLDTNVFGSKNEVSRRWVDLQAARSFGALRLELAASSNWGDFTPAGSDGRVPEVRPPTPGSQLGNGEGRWNVSAGAVGVHWSVAPGWHLTLAGNALHRFQRGTGRLSFRGGAEGVSQRTDITRSGARLELAGSWGVARFRVKADAATSDETIRQSFGRSLQDSTQNVDDAGGRVEVFIPGLFGSSWRAWTSYRELSYDNEVRVLEWGYLPAPDTTKSTAYGLVAQKRWESTYLGLGLSGQHARWDLSAPFFEPVYDPSMPPRGTRGDSYDERLTVSSGLFGTSQNLWVEAGYLRQRWAFRATRPFVELAPVNEELTGLVGSVNWEWQWQERLAVRAQGEWVGSRNAVHNGLTRAQLDLWYRLAGAWRAFGRYAYSNLDWSRARSREFTGHVVALGLQWSGK
ncbi:MAG: hypothetical protein ACP5NF_01540 [Thermoanaerobaculum sp.]